MLGKKFKKLFYLSQKIRMIEEKIIEIYPSDKIQSPVHLSIGQESIASCLCENLRIDDWILDDLKTPNPFQVVKYLKKGVNKLSNEGNLSKITSQNPPVISFFL